MNTYTVVDTLREAIKAGKEWRRARRSKFVTEYLYL